jgi:hypothetical protein
MSCDALGDESNECPAPKRSQQVDSGLEQNKKFFFKQCRLLGSNQGSSHYKCDALPLRQAGIVSLRLCLFRFIKHLCQEREVNTPLCTYPKKAVIIQELVVSAQAVQ